MKKFWFGLLGLIAALAVFAGTSNYTSFAQFHDGTVPTWDQTAADGAVAIEKTLEVDGAVDLDSTLSVAGAATLAGAVTSNGGLQSVCNGACGTPATATAAGDLYVEDALEVDGATDLDGTLSVAGATTLTDMDTAVILQGDAPATCTLGQWFLDTATTNELCYCQATDTFYCISFTTVSGPTD